MRQKRGCLDWTVLLFYEKKSFFLLQNIAVHYMLARLRLDEYQQHQQQRDDDNEDNGGGGAGELPESGLLGPVKILSSAEP